MEIREFQELMHQIYYQRDQQRGLAGTFVWFAEEVGELAKSIRERNNQNYAEEFSDVLAWLTSLANLLGIDLEQAVGKYKQGCSRCGKIPCECGQKSLK
ncbi:MAG: nucleotide pyrophosphohydrolase [Candidatus Latescibacteria bacterium]|nr:nucleotide pyrophosphohydrolase [Candidatus Latescibacterota bacterium]